MWNCWDHLFDSPGFPPRWDCRFWTLGHGWLHILSNLGVGPAYLAIPCIWHYFLTRQGNFPFEVSCQLMALRSFTELETLELTGQHDLEGNLRTFAPNMTCVPGSERRNGRSPSPLPRRKSWRGDGSSGSCGRDVSYCGWYAHRHFENPGVILLDKYLPLVDGMEVLRQIRADPRTCLVRALMPRHRLKIATSLKSTSWASKVTLSSPWISSNSAKPPDN
jgi:CheY-like chemotaxis protein